MKRFLTILTTILLLSSFSLIQAQPDREGSKDPPLFNRMPNYWIQSYEEVDFNRYEFPIDKNKTIAVEGHYYRVNYYPNTGVKPASPLAILNNYGNAVKTIGGEIVGKPSDKEIVLKVVQGESEYWVHVKMLNNTQYSVNMIQKANMTQDVVANAQSMAQSIKDTGKASLYGIYFDTGKAGLKPESEPALEEIAKLLKADPQLKLYVVGHTDNVGTLEINLKLSKGRADAVIKALTEKYGIAKARLIAFGHGPTAPVASNATEEGKAKNRRVELVQQ